jgi:hypothetical protein
MTENHFTELKETTFLTLSLLVHFRESLHRINRESLLFFKKNCLAEESELQNFEQNYVP